MSGPLEGLRILDLTRLLPGGYATLLLADMGADVIKVEEPHKGDYIRWMPPMVGEMSSAHIALNRNKRSITLDLKKEDGVELLKELAGTCDVVIESFRPGVMDRLGVGYEALKVVQPMLIYCAVTGYGQDGPRAQTAGHDVNYIGYSGVLSVIGREDDRPVIPGVQIGDLAGGGMAAVIAILAALHRRSLTGEGEYCDISMMDGAMSWLSIHAADFVAGGDTPRPEGMHLSGRYPCYRIYPAADGWLTVGALEPQFWAALCDALGRDDLAGDGFAAGDRRAEAIASLEELFRTKTRSEWMEFFGDRDVCVGPVNDFEEAFADPQVLHREMVVETELPGGESWKHIGNPLKMRGAPGDVTRLPPPKLGEQTTEILGEIGLSWVEVETLRADGVV